MAAKRRKLEDGLQNPVAPLDYLSGVVNKVAPAKELEGTLDTLDKALQTLGKDPVKDLAGNPQLGGTWVISSLFSIFTIVKDYAKQRVQKAFDIVGMVKEDVVGLGKKLLTGDEKDKKKTEKSPKAGGVAPKETQPEELTPDDGISNLENNTKKQIENTGHALAALTAVGDGLTNKGPGFPECNQQPEVENKLSKMTAPIDPNRPPVPPSPGKGIVR